MKTEKQTLCENEGLKEHVKMKIYLLPFYMNLKRKNIIFLG